MSVKPLFAKMVDNSTDWQCDYDYQDPLLLAQFSEIAKIRKELLEAILVSYYCSLDRA